MIYFLQAVEGGPIKIGFTDNFPARLQRLENHYRCPLVVLATMEGNREREAEIHRQFLHLRFGMKEQFRPDAELLAFIGRPLLAGPNPEAVEVMASFSGAVVRLRQDVVEIAKKVAALRGISMAEYISDRMDPLAKADLELEARKLTKK